MRLITMHTLLLLLCALAVTAESPLPCGTWLIEPKEIWDEVEFAEESGGKKELHCKPVDKTPRQIIFNEIRFDNVKCTATGFSGNPIESNELKPEMLMAHPGFQMRVSCAEYCTATTENGAVDEKKSYNKKEIHCADDTFDLFHNNKQINGNVARCNTTGWYQMYPEKSLDFDKLKPQHFECKKANPRCTRQNSKGIKFDDASKTLSCDGGDTLWKIEFNNKVHDSIRCEKHIGTYVWKAKNEIIADASTILVATCVEPCSVRSAKKLRYDKNTKVASCIGDKETSFLKIISSKTLNTIVSLKCDVVDGWTYSNNNPSSSYKLDYGPYELSDTDCVEYCGSSGKGTTVKKNSRNDLEVTCTDPGFGVVVNSRVYTSLTCQTVFEPTMWRSENWTSYIEIASNTQRLDDLTCAKLPRICELPSAVQGMQYDKDKKTLSCPGTVARAIKIGSKLYEYLACHEVSGWAGRNMNGYTDLIADTDLSSSVTCIEYCKAEGAGIKLEFDREEHNNYDITLPWFHIHFLDYFVLVKVTCADSRLLYYEGERVDTDTDSAICSLRKGWRKSIKSDPFSDDTINTMEFECRKAPSTTTTSTTTVTTTTSIAPSKSPTTSEIIISANTTKTPIVWKPEMEESVDEAQQAHSSTAIVVALVGVMLPLV